MEGKDKEGLPQRKQRTAERTETARRLEREASERLVAAGRGTFFGVAADVFEGGFEEDFFDCVLNILPKLAKAAVFAFRTLGAEAFARVCAAGFSKGAIDDAKHLTDGNLIGIAGERVTATNSAAALKDSTVFELEKDLLEVL